MILKFELSVDTNSGEFSIVNTSTGEIKTVEIPKKTKKSTKVEASEPQLILEDNKYCLNTAAVELMGLTSEDKLDIKYEKNGGRMIPVIGTDEAFGTKGGNKLTKSNTVACRGSKNDELSKYGKVFSIKPHSSKEGLFVLTGDNDYTASLEGDNNISTEEVDEELPLDLSLEALVDEKDANIEEIDSSYFKL